MMWHFYALDTGLFSGRTYGAPDEQFLARNIPEGHGAKEGVSDWQFQRVDLATGSIVPYQPPAPPDHLWHEQTRSWYLNPVIATRNARETEILQALKALDERLVRPYAELLLNPEDSVARGVAIGIIAEKEVLRNDLHQIRLGKVTDEETTND